MAQNGLLINRERNGGPGIAKVQCVCDLSGRVGSKALRRQPGSREGVSETESSINPKAEPGGALPSFSSLWAIALLLFTCCCRFRWRKTFSSKICFSTSDVSLPERKVSSWDESNTNKTIQLVFFYFLCSSKFRLGEGFGIYDGANTGLVFNFACLEPKLRRAKVLVGNSQGKLRTQ